VQGSCSHCQHPALDLQGAIAKQFAQHVLGAFEGSSLLMKLLFRLWLWAFLVLLLQLLLKTSTLHSILTSRSAATRNSKKQWKQHPDSSTTVQIYANIMKKQGAMPNSSTAAVAASLIVQFLSIAMNAGSIPNQALFFTLAVNDCSEYGLTPHNSTC
jgi:hypothetical protein